MSSASGSSKSSTSAKASSGKPSKKSSAKRPRDEDVAEGDTVDKKRRAATLPQETEEDNESELREYSDMVTSYLKSTVFPAANAAGEESFRVDIKALISSGKKFKCFDDAHKLPSPFLAQTISQICARMSSLKGKEGMDQLLGCLDLLRDQYRSEMKTRAFQPCRMDDVHAFINPGMTDHEAATLRSTCALRRATDKRFMSLVSRAMAAKPGAERAAASEKAIQEMYEIMTFGSEEDEEIDKIRKEAEEEENPSSSDDEENNSDYEGEEEEEEEDGYGSAQSSNCE